VIRFDEVAVRYPRSDVDALAGVSLEAPRGTITAVVGPNGSGKSTLVRALVGRIALRSGVISVDGDALASLQRPDIARRVAVVSQREDLAFPVTVGEYVALGRFPHLGIWHAAREADRRAIADSMREAGVEALTTRRIDALSGGEWQRVRLARALSQGGSTLVLDEPTAFLDVAHEMAVFELLHRLADSGQAVLLVSHQLNLVARFAERMVLLQRGSIVATGTPTDVMRPDVLERVYEWPLAVTHDPVVGAPALVPLRANSRRGGN
jgi:ABC-type cobalamin/Fe3+-siderophores transport system ATPase subunit